MAFNTPTGHFEYLVLPFGLVNTSPVSQALINDVLNSQFLGSILSAEGIRMDPAKERAVSDWPVPGSRKELQKCIGFAHFYRHFIKNSGQVAVALTSSKTKFCWSNAAQAAFDDLKFRFTTAPILIFSDPNRQFVVEVDASEVGVEQFSPKDPLRIISYIRVLIFLITFLPQSKIMTSATESCWQYSWLWASGIIVWRRVATPFLMWTDHKNLEYIRSAKRFNDRQTRWASFFSRFNFILSYRPGSKNSKHDALSRQFGSPDDTLPSDTILPSDFLVGAVFWGVEKQETTPFGLSSGSIICV